MKATHSEKMTVHRGSWGGRFPIYQIGDRGFSYNSSLREWDLFLMYPDDSGSIYDYLGQLKTKQEAQSWALQQ